MDTLFVLSVGFILYVYLMYPILVCALSKQTGDGTVNSADSSAEEGIKVDDIVTISIVITTFNAERFIKTRLDNISALNYPQEKIQTIVVDDGSTDNTVALVEGYTNLDLQVIRMECNKGKASALNAGINAANTEFILFTDARQQFDRDVVQKLLVKFESPNIAAVTGNLMIEKGKGDPGLYWHYEKKIRSWESDYKSLLGVTGAIYMAKKSMLPSFPTGLILDDMFGPAHMNKNGLDVKFAQDAIAYDFASQSLREEFNRKVRTLVGNYQLVRFEKWLINPFKNRLFFEFFSHKIGRLLVPHAMIIAFVSSYYSEFVWFNIAFYLQAFVYLYIAYCYFYKYKRKGKTHFLLSFFMLNLAALKASIVFWNFSPDKIWIKH